MKKLCILFFCSFVSISLIAQHQVYELQLNFNSGSTSISEENLSIIEKFIHELKLKNTSENWAFTIEGYADNVGDFQHNLQLSEKRASQVKNHLVSSTFNSDKIQTFGRGNEGEKDLVSNRSVKITAFEDNKEYSTFYKDNNTTLLRVNPKKEVKFTTSSGTEVTIPANSIVDKNNKPVQYSVELEFTEYRDQIDILNSGINMNSDKAYFKSAGMFDLNASIGNENLKLKEGTEATANFVLSDTIGDYNFYQLNHNTWDEINEQSGGVINTENPNMNELIKYKLSSNNRTTEFVYNEEVSPNYTCNIIEKNPLTLIRHAQKALDSSIHSYRDTLPDLTLFAQRYKDPAYAGSILRDEQEKKNKIKIHASLNINKDTIPFSFKTITDEHPELALLEKYKWSYIKSTGILSPDDLNNTYEDGRLTYDRNGLQFNLELKAATGYIKIPLEVNYNKEVKNKLKRDQTIWSEYSVELRAREYDFNEVIKKAKDKFIMNKVWMELSICDNRDCFWEFMRPYASDQELRNGKYQWYNWTFENRELIKSRLDSLENIYATNLDLALQQRRSLEGLACAKEKHYNLVRKDLDIKDIYQTKLSYKDGFLSSLSSIQKPVIEKQPLKRIRLSLNSFGTYNADQLIPIAVDIQIQKKVAITYLDQFNQRIKVKDLFMIHKDNNVVIRIAGQKKLSPYDLPNQPLRNYSLLIRNTENELFTVSDLATNKIDNVRKGGKTTVKISKIEQHITSKEDMVKYVLAH